jgi:S-adenosylmethionine hydrolase
MRPIITLTTDFGEGRYLAQVKGVLLSMCPEATLVDITNDIPAHDIASAAYLLRDVVPTFPVGTIHVVVVDPGVGTTRRGLAIRASNSAAGQFFVGPDNGVFSELLSKATIHELARSAPTRPHPSSVFHGRDVFAPAAAHLANGLGLETLGPIIHDPVRLKLPKAEVTANEVRGQAIYADRFGNIATNIDASMIPKADEEGLRVEISWARIDRVAVTYADVAIGEMLALVNSSGRLEIAVREGSAATRLQLQKIRGTPVRICRGKPSMYGAATPA